MRKFPQWSKLTTSQWDELKGFLEKAQNPESNDPMMRVQRELDETKVILHKTMASLLERGEKLDDLVAKSDELSAQSKMFYKTAKKTNACCVSFLYSRLQTYI
jgi:synaptobrevin family protein YKT6